MNGLLRTAFILVLLGACIDANKGKNKGKGKGKDKPKDKDKDKGKNKKNDEKDKDTKDKNIAANEDSIDSWMYSNNDPFGLLGSGSYLDTPFFNRDLFAPYANYHELSDGMDGQSKTAEEIHRWSSSWHEWLDSFSTLNSDSEFEAAGSYFDWSSWEFRPDTQSDSDNSNLKDSILDDGQDTLAGSNLDLEDFMDMRSTLYDDDDFSSNDWYNSKLSDDWDSWSDWLDSFSSLSSSVNDQYDRWTIDEVEGSDILTYDSPFDWSEWGLNGDEASMLMDSQDHMKHHDKDGEFLLSQLAVTSTVRKFLNLEMDLEGTNPSYQYYRHVLEFHADTFDEDHDNDGHDHEDGRIYNTKPPQREKLMTFVSETRNRGYLHYNLSPPPPPPLHDSQPTQKSLQEILNLMEESQPSMEEYSLDTIRDLIETIKLADELVLSDRSWVCDVITESGMLAALKEIVSADNCFLETFTEEAEEGNVGSEDYDHVGVEDHDHVGVEDHDHAEVEDHDHDEVEDHDHVGVEDHGHDEVEDHDHVEVEDHDHVEVEDHDHDEVEDHDHVEVEDHDHVGVKDHDNVGVEDEVNVVSEDNVESEDNEETIQIELVNDNTVYFPDLIHETDRKTKVYLNIGFLEPTKPSFNGYNQEYQESISLPEGDPIPTSEWKVERSTKESVMDTVTITPTTALFKLDLTSSPSRAHDTIDISNLINNEPPVHVDDRYYVLELTSNRDEGDKEKNEKREKEEHGKEREEKYRHEKDEKGKDDKKKPKKKGSERGKKRGKRFAGLGRRRWGRRLHDGYKPDWEIGGRFRSRHDDRFDESNDDYDDDYDDYYDDYYKDDDYYDDGKAEDTIVIGYEDTYDAYPIVIADTVPALAEPYPSKHVHGMETPGKHDPVDWPPVDRSPKQQTQDEDPVGVITKHIMYKRMFFSFLGNMCKVTILSEGCHREQ